MDTYSIAARRARSENFADVFLKAALETDGLDFVVAIEDAELFGTRASPFTIGTTSSRNRRAPKTKY